MGQFVKTNPERDHRVRAVQERSLVIAFDWVKLVSVTLQLQLRPRSSKFEQDSLRMVFDIRQSRHFTFPESALLSLFLFRLHPARVGF